MSYGHVRYFQNCPNTGLLHYFSDSLGFVSHIGIPETGGHLWRRAKPFLPLSSYSSSHHLEVCFVHISGWCFYMQYWFLWIKLPDVFISSRVTNYIICSSMTDPASVRKAFEEATKLGGLWGPVASTPSTKGCCSLIWLVFLGHLSYMVVSGDLLSQNKAKGGFSSPCSLV